MVVGLRQLCAHQITQRGVLVRASHLLQVASAEAGALEDLAQDGLGLRLAVAGLLWWRRGGAGVCRCAGCGLLACLLQVVLPGPVQLLEVLQAEGQGGGYRQVLGSGSITMLDCCVATRCTAVPDQCAMALSVCHSRLRNSNPSHQAACMHACSSFGTLTVSSAGYCASRSSMSTWLMRSMRQEPRHHTFSLRLARSKPCRCAAQQGRSALAL